MWFTIHGSYGYDMCWRLLGLNIFCVALFWGVLEMVDMFFQKSLGILINYKGSKNKGRAIKEA